MLALLLVACAPAGPTAGPGATSGDATGGLTVLAASSLTESLQAVAKRWEAAGHAPVTLSFDASSKLAKQIEGGAPADLFLSADEAWVDTLQGAGRLDPATRTNLVTNTLVVVVGAQAAYVPTDAAGLADARIQHLALAAETVPAGRYGRAALTTLGGWDAVSARVVSGDNVRTTLGWVAKGEAEAGVVYATDAKVEPAVKVAFVFPAASHPPIVYPAAVVVGAPHAAEAAAFLGYCRGAEAQAIFTAAGFGAAP